MTLRDQIKQVIDDEPVAIFMKGTPERPACGNSLRALIMSLERLSEQEILDRELATGAPQVYRLTESGDVAEYEELVRSEGRDDHMG